MLEQRQRPMAFSKVAPPVAKGPEEKDYYLLITYPEGTIERNDWMIVEGRREAAERAKTYILDGCDLDNSKVLVSSSENSIEGMVSIYWFMYKMQGLYPDLGMDIESFAAGDPVEVQQAADEVRNNPQVSIMPSDNGVYEGKDV